MEVFDALRTGVWEPAAGPPDEPEKAQETHQETSDIATRADEAIPPEVGD